MTGRAPDLLEQLDRLAVGPAPIASLLADGRAARRRRGWRVAGGAAVAAAVIVAGVGVVSQALGTRVAEPPGPSAPEVVGQGSSGTRLVGIGRVAVAVPAAWSDDAASCNSPSRDTSYFPFPQDCIGWPHPEVSSVAITSGGSGETGIAPSRFRPDGEVDGFAVVASGNGCSPAREKVCRLAFGVPDLDAYFAVTLPAGSSAGAQAERIRDSLVVLPDDQTTVPSVPVDDAARAARLLRAAGLSPVIEGVGCIGERFCGAFGPAETDPAIGSVVPTGTPVAVALRPERAPRAAGPSGSSGAPSQPEPARLVLGPDGVGALRLGMSTEEVRATGAARTLDGSTHDGYSPGCRLLVYGRSVGAAGARFDGTLSARQGVERLWATRAMATPAGIRIGSSLAEVDAAYDPRIVRPGRLVSVRASPEAVYEIQLGRRVRSIALRLNEQDCNR